MADIPEHFYETARSIRNGVIWESNAATRVLAEALYGAWKEGEAEAEAENEWLRALMRKAHAVMRECGWQLAVGCEPQGDGILEAACTEIEADFADALSAARRALEGGE